PGSLWDQAAVSTGAWTIRNKPAVASRHKGGANRARGSPASAGRNRPPPANPRTAIQPPASRQAWRLSQAKSLTSGPHRASGPPTSSNPFRRTHSVAWRERAVAERRPPAPPEGPEYGDAQAGRYFECSKLESFEVVAYASSLLILSLFATAESQP